MKIISSTKNDSIKRIEEYIKFLKKMILDTLLKKIHFLRNFFFKRHKERKI